MGRSRCGKERRQDWKKLCKIPSSRRGLILTYDVYTFFVLCVSLHLIALSGKNGHHGPRISFPCGLVGQTLSYSTTYLLMYMFVFTGLMEKLVGVEKRWRG
ncbi:hypothetical protein BDP81DRAFT_11545 [Colletotrichum phormii]|uniref:Uncharacterized protein n=1 Tax=Colletotrichum phormii TaxID=359342 RepID=A0AAJ0A7B3_9PEZI|nr:uncharacterized protein BDP81DRAFT_11545 [Colletotrichum phormii]KAK1655870.1 hypothetical protein BDP81DRAFT_11545 [Colletotrichum phormii]